MKKNIRPRNTRGQYHGYQEWYYTNDKLMFRGNVKNNNWDGYRELYYSSGKIGLLTFYIV